MNRSLAIIIIVILVVVGVAAYALTRNSNPQTQTTGSTQPSDTIKLSSSGSMGNFLVDANGMTLYYFTKDNIDKSNCAVGPCLSAWPAFSTSEIVVTSPLSSSDFSLITRDDGTTQTTYKGWPLYHFANDKQPGDVLGEGVVSEWYVMADPFYTVMVQNQATVSGNYLTDPKGMTLYSFNKDTKATSTNPPVSACTAQCLATWPVFSIDNPIVPSLLKNSDFAVFTRADGVSQLSYKGQPLYYYAQDVNPGDLKGQNINKSWFVVHP